MWNGTCARLSVRVCWRHVFLLFDIVIRINSFLCISSLRRRVSGCIAFNILVPTILTNQLIHWFYSIRRNGSSFSGFRDHTVNFDEAKVFFSSFLSLCCVCSALNCCRRARTFAFWMVGPVVPSPHRIRKKRRSGTQQVQQRYTNRMFSLFFSPDVS